MRPAWVLAFALTAAACDRPEPPPVATRRPSLDAGDLAVVKALFDDLLRPGRPDGARFLVVDVTMPVCRRDPASLGPQPGRCLALDYGTLAADVVPQSMSRTLALHLPSWNAMSLPVAGSLGDDVLFVSPTLIDTVPPRMLLEGYPRGSDVVMLSAPAYPAPRVAVVLYSITSGTGAARLERQPDGRWKVAAKTFQSVE